MSYNKKDKMICTSCDKKDKMICMSYDKKVNENHLNTLVNFSYNIIYQVSFVYQLWRESMMAKQMQMTQYANKWDEKQCVK